jgi:hypothetical protein
MPRSSFAGPLRTAGLVLLLSTPACTGTVADDPAPTSGAEAPAGRKPPSGDRGPAAPVPPPEKTGEPSPLAACVQPQVARSPLRRLSNFEYDNTVRDLLSGFEVGKPSIDANLPGDNALDIFDNEADHQRVVQAVAEAYFRSAELVTARVLAAPGALGKLLACDVAKDGEEACARSFLSGFARRAYRRPLDEAETARLERFFAARKSSDGFEGAVRATIERLLQSPQFLYRLERTTAGVARVTPHEMASRLSYFFWGTMPDAELFAAADSGKLATREEVRRQAERLLSSTKAKPALGRLFSQWLGLDGLPELMKNEALFPMWNDALKQRLIAETTRFTEHLLFDPGSAWGDLLTASYSFMDEGLARFYGRTGPKGTSFARVDVDPRRAAGVLGHAGILAMGADEKAPVAVFRGVYVRERLMCEHLPPPPDGLDIPALPEPDPKVSSRERNRMHSDNPACAGCHRLLDPLGYGFERFDAVGLWRQDDAGQPIDDSGEIVGGGDAEGPFRGVVELGQRLGGSRTARACLVNSVFRFSFGRKAEALDRCTLDALEKSLDRTGGNLRELLLELPLTDAFVHLTTGGL